ncbi:MAG TPA: pyridoxamine 5'-phosphate oxidase family protein [Gammaproteobacteria bacterium]|nr:pyridoxamine 5'-phosphate oxidase family protein [Gammaproteobacteria bacterium]
MDADDRQHLVSLVRTQRWASLATVGEDGMPLASSVAFALAPGGRGFLLHLSRLAGHTRNLLQRPDASLVIGEPDPGEGDPQALARFSVQGRVERLQPDSPAFSEARTAYIARLPDSEQRFGFSDFELFLLAPARGHFVGGFARAFQLDTKAVASVLRECLVA